MCSAWATSCPAAVKRAQEKSLLSLMFGEKLDLRRTTPISSATEMSEFLKISNDTGSRFSMAGVRFRGLPRLAYMELHAWSGQPCPLQNTRSTPQLGGYFS